MLWEHLYLYLDIGKEDKRKWTRKSNHTWPERIWICFTEYSALLSQIYPFNAAVTHTHILRFKLHFQLLLDFQKKKKWLFPYTALTDRTLSVFSVMQKLILLNKGVLCINSLLKGSNHLSSQQSAPHNTDDWHNVSKYIISQPASNITSLC
jgi:hypothetical protein